jgi:copper(I)-binding protein
MSSRLTVLAVLLAAACGGSAPPAVPASLSVHGAWVRSADSGTVTAAYLVVSNPESAAVTLTGVASPLAESVSMHMTHEMGGLVHMMPVDSAPVGAGDSLVFAENARHLMVNGLRRKLAAGDSLPITLTFTGGRTLNVAAVVKSPY